MIGRDTRRWINDKIRTELLAMNIVNNNQFAAFVPYVLIIDRPERVSVYNHSITCLQGIEELLFFPDDLYLKTTFYQILLNSFRYEATIETDPILIFDHLCK